MASIKAMCAISLERFMVTGMGGPDIRQALVYRFWLGCISIVRCDGTHELFIVVEPACRQGHSTSLVQRTTAGCRSNRSVSPVPVRRYRIYKPYEPVVHELFEHLEHGKKSVVLVNFFWRFFSASFGGEVVVDEFEVWFDLS